MSRTVVPVANLARRAVEHGRIRLGVQGDRGPRSIDTFRLTSQDQEVIEQIAGLYGGEAKPWSPKKGRQEFEVITETDELPIRLPPDPLGGTPLYEAWTAGGIQRRCDGVTAEVPTRTPDGVEMAQENCICDRTDRFTCKPITRLNVIIPTVRFAGTWRLESKAWGAAHEMPGMVELIQALQGQGLPRAVLAIDKRSKVEGGKTHHWTVPVLRLDDTLDELQQNAAQLEPTAVRAELPPGEDASPQTDGPPGLAPARFEILRTAARLHLSAEDVAGFTFTVSDGQTESLVDLDAAQLARIVDVFGKLERHEVVFDGLDRRRAVVRKAS